MKRLTASNKSTDPGPRRGATQPTRWENPTGSCGVQAGITKLIKGTDGGQPRTTRVQTLDTWLREQRPALEKHSQPQAGKPRQLSSQETVTAEQSTHHTRKAMSELVKVKTLNF